MDVSNDRFKQSLEIMTSHHVILDYVHMFENWISSSTRLESEREKLEKYSKNPNFNCPSPKKQSRKLYSVNRPSIDELSIKSQENAI